jgi:hypothetical protein
MSATKIAAAYLRWHELWTANFPTDEAGNAAMEERAALKAYIIGMRAGSGADILAKVRMLYEHARACWVEDEMIASIAADLERLEGTDETLVKLFDERMVLSAGAVAADTRRDFDTAHVLSDRFNKIDDTIAETPAMSFRGLCVKARIAQLTCDDQGGWFGIIALSMSADIERLAGKGGGV